MSWHVIGPQPTTVPLGLPDNLAELRDLTARHSLPYDAGITRVVLPRAPAARLIDIQGVFEPPRAEQVPSVRCLCYGSSITHGAAAVRPTGSYAMRLGHLLGVDVVNLGFGGGAHLEPEMADHIAERRDWHMATLEMGINIIGSVDAEEFERRVDYFVTRIATAHPDKWIFCIDLFTCRHDFDENPKIAAFRRAVEQKVRAMDMPKLVHVPGSQLLTSLSGLTFDLVHPSPAGMEEMAANLARAIRERTG